MSPVLRALLALAVVLVAVVLVVELRQPPVTPAAPGPPTAPEQATTNAPRDIGAVRQDVRERIDSLGARLDEAPDDTLALRTLGRLLQSAHRSTEASALFERYLAIDPSNRLVRTSLVVTLAGREAWDEAIAHGMLLVETDPADAAAQYNLGAVYANAGRLDEAREWWTRVVQRGENDEMVRRATESLARLEEQR